LEVGEGGASSDMPHMSSVESSIEVG
jgi:hypothetical protein